MDAGSRELRDAIERRFNPSQPRDPDGQWSDGIPGPSVRIHAQGDQALHLSSRDSRLSIRIPFDGSEDDEGGSRDSLTLDASTAAEFAEELQILDTAAADYNRRVKKLWDKASAINPDGGGDDDPDPASKAAWAAVGELAGDGQRIAGGQLDAADGSELHYELRMGDEPGDIDLLIGLRTPDVPDDWELYEIAADGPGARLSWAQMRKLRREVDKLASGTDVARYSPEQPRVEAGSASGGQFAAAAAEGKKKSNGSETLGYDAKSNRGTGYGTAGGDARVKRLQEALNRLGLTDAAGKPLKVDGKLGPKTTAAIKKLQRQLGAKPDGQVTPALLDRITAMKGAKPAAKASPRPAAKPTPKGKPKATLSDKGSGKLQMRGGLDVLTTYDRTFALDDIQIQRSGDGRTVEAYAAMFDAPYEVRDQHGHYMEVIDRAAFNRTLNGGAGRNAMCLYNHGMSVVDGKPDSLAQVPLGTPLEIRPDGRGLLTVTRYNRSALADAVLESVRNGDVRAQSFRGRIVRSSPNGRLPRQRYGQALPTVTRHELGLSDYGPTPVPVNHGAEIMAVRSVQDLLEELEELSFDEKEELLRSLELSTHDGDPDDEEEEDEDDGLEGDVAATATPDNSGPGAEDPPAERSTAHSGRLEIVRARLRMEWTRRGVRRGEAA